MNTKAVNLTGCFSPFRPSGRIGIPDQPCFIQLHDQPDLFVTVYSTVEALKKAMDFCGITDYKIKVIEDGREFTYSILESGTVRLMFDPQIISKERTKWTEVILD